MAREPEFAAFEPALVAGSTRRPTGVLVGWLAALVGIAGVAAANVAPGGDEDSGREAVAAETRAPAGPATPGPAPGPPLGRPIVVLVITEARSSDQLAGVPTRRLEVAGRLLVRAERVRITLEGREDHILATVVREPVRLPPRVGPIVPRTFIAVFELPAWRHGGMWVTVTAFDRDGERIGRLRQRVEVYPLTGVVPPG